jgi:hypothetical protein
MSFAEPFTFLGPITMIISYNLIGENRIMQRINRTKHGLLTTISLILLLVIAMPIGIIQVVQADYGPDVTIIGTGDPSS